MHTRKSNLKPLTCFLLIVSLHPLQGSGLNGTYFDRSYLEEVLVQRVDATLDFDWGETEPVEGTGSAYSIRWTGGLTSGDTGQHTLYFRINGGIRVWFNNQLIINNWDDGSQYPRAIVEMHAGVTYPIKIEYKQEAGTARFRFLWQSDNIPKQIVAQSALSPTLPSIAPALKAHPADRFVDMIGINIHLDYPDTVYYQQYEEIIKPKLLESGIRRVRQPYRSDFPSYKKNVIQDLAMTTSIRFSILEPGTGSYASLAVSAADINALMQDLNQQVDSVEGHNEPDLFLPGDWAAITATYQTALHTAVQESSYAGSIAVLSPSIIGESYFDNPGDLSASITHTNTHPYTGAEPPETDRLYKELWSARHLAGEDSATAITEFGFHTAEADPAPHQPAVTENVQAKYLLRSFLKYHQVGMEWAYSYEFIDLFPDSSNDDIESNWGILDNDGRAKPAFVALKNTIHLLSDPGAVFAPEALAFSVMNGFDEDLRYQLFQKSDRRFYLILWLEKRSYDTATSLEISNPAVNVTITFGQPFLSARWFRPQSASEASNLWEGLSEVTLEVLDEIQILELEFSPYRRHAMQSVATQAVQGLAADTDGDGATDLEEFAFGGQATDASLRSQQPDYYNAGDSMKLKFLCRTEAMNGYQLGSSPDLTSWTWATLPNNVDSSPRDAHYQWLEFDPYEEGTPPMKEFFRIRYIPADSIP